jgi:hypothetical protein
MRYRRVRMSPEMIQMLDEQREAFKKKFGREPRPEDPIIYDEDCDEPTPLSEEKIHEVMINALVAAGARPEIVYACRKTGRLVTESNQHLLTRAELQEWIDAAEEYLRLHPHDA